ncbi:6-phosphofructokinase [Dethiobacter alkaliphilus]|uniref:6-phosphofructokinase n=1 Tax=Dethiobacter alkaliphilus TaxID=427926 RepID=UPI002227BECA|nr:6-phosphofructokinase [Dethiobacter alkaliphilus]MCW3489601.1 6-phosphofructokinase [Dethiobacter alkaliphilus]
MSQKIKRLGILTGGGDCPGLNAVIRAVAKTALYRYEIEVVGIMDGYGGVIENRSMILEDHHVSGILHRGGTILGTTNRDNPFRYPVGEKNGQTVWGDVSDKAIANLEKMGVDVLVAVGGDGSLFIGNELYKKGVPVVGIPKTIDNDLSATDVTFGFDTALNTATDAIDKLHTTAESHHRVMILEVMGRDAGWIALHSGTAGGADVILIPEINFSYEAICKKISERQQKGKKFSIMVVAEGAKLPGGEQIYQEERKDNPHLSKLGGVGNVIGDEIQRRCGVETRVTVLGHLQRGGTPTPFDRILGTRFGVKAAELAMNGEFGQMTCLCSGEIQSVPLSDAVKEQKLIQADSELVRAAKSVGVSFGD